MKWGAFAILDDANAEGPNPVNLERLVLSDCDLECVGLMLQQLQSLQALTHLALWGRGTSELPEEHAAAAGAALAEAATFGAAAAAAAGPAAAPGRPVARPGAATSSWSCSPGRWRG